MTISNANLDYSELLLLHDSAEAAAPLTFDSLMGFRLDSVLLAELHTGRYGELGEAKPYHVSGDNGLAISLLACFVIVVVSLAAYRSVALARVKEFFLSKNVDDDLAPSTPSFYLHILVTINCLLLAIMTFVGIHQLMPQVMEWVDKYTFIAVVFGVFVVFYLLKWLLYSLVNTVFFGGKKSLQWNKDFLFITALQTLMVFPVVLLLVYFNLSVDNAIICFAVVLFLNKMLTFYKGWVIFFKQKRLYLQFFLYFCALEMMPLLAFLGGWLMLNNSL